MSDFHFDNCYKLAPQNPYIRKKMQVRQEVRKLHKLISKKSKQMWSSKSHSSRDDINLSYLQDEIKSTDRDLSSEGTEFKNFLREQENSLFKNSPNSIAMLVPKLKMKKNSQVNNSETSTYVQNRQKTLEVKAKVNKLWEIRDEECDGQMLISTRRGRNRRNRVRPSRDFTRKNKFMEKKKDIQA